MSINENQSNLQSNSDHDVWNGNGVTESTQNENGATGHPHCCETVDAESGQQSEVEAVEEHKSNEEDEATLEKATKEAESGGVGQTNDLCIRPKDHEEVVGDELKDMVSVVPGSRDTMLVEPILEKTVTEDPIESILKETLKDGAALAEKENETENETLPGQSMEEKEVAGTEGVGESKEKSVTEKSVEEEVGEERAVMEDAIVEETVTNQHVGKDEKESEMVNEDSASPQEDGKDSAESKEPIHSPSKSGIEVTKPDEKESETVNEDSASPQEDGKDLAKSKEPIHSPSKSGIEVTNPDEKESETVNEDSASLQEDEKDSTESKEPIHSPSKSGIEVTNQDEKESETVNEDSASPQEDGKDSAKSKEPIHSPSRSGIEVTNPDEKESETVNEDSASPQEDEKDTTESKEPVHSPSKSGIEVTNPDEKESETVNEDSASPQENRKDSTKSKEPVRSPSKSGIEVTSAQVFVRSSTHEDTSDSGINTEIEQDVPPVPLVSDQPAHETKNDEKNTNMVSSSFQLTEETPSDNVLNDIRENIEASLESSINDSIEQSITGKSMFFVSPDHVTEIEHTAQSPKETRRMKSYSVLHTKSESPPAPDQEKVKLSTRFKRSFKRTNKIRREPSMDVGVSLLPPQLATTWDPTCILEELYADCRPIVPRSSMGENCRYAGYLDKLPVNQSKPAVMKGWKHRYFRVTRGSLFYYDDEKSQKVLSFVRLTDSKIVLHQESLKVEIIEKGGNFIFLRAETKESMFAVHRALQLESVHPTLTHRISLSPSRSMTTVILDLGSCSIRAGLLSEGDNYPQLFFPNVCAFSEDTLVACGNDALLPSTRGVSKLVYPRRHRARMDSTISIRDCFSAVIESVCQRLDVTPESSNIIVSVSPIMPENEQQILAEVILESLGFQGLLIQEQTTLALYSYNCTMGVSVSIGDSISVVPIMDGYKVEGADQHIPLGGSNISESLSKLAAAKDVRYFSDTEMYIIRQVKENLCFLSQNFEEDAEKCEETPSLYTRAVDVDRFQLPDHKKVIALDIALFKAPEGIFQPALWGKDVPGIHEMIHRSIEMCPIDTRRDMTRHIYLSGGTSMLTGFPERLKAELSKLFPRIEIVIHANEERYHAAYLGASILASLNAFQKSLVTLDDYLTKGLDAFKDNGAGEKD